MKGAQPLQISTMRSRQRRTRRGKPRVCAAEQPSVAQLEETPALRVQSLLAVTGCTKRDKDLPYVKHCSTAEVWTTSAKHSR